MAYADCHNTVEVPGMWLDDYCQRQQTISTDDEPVEVRLMTAPQIERWHYWQHSRLIAILQQQVAELMTEVGHLRVRVKQLEEGGG